MLPLLRAIGVAGIVFSTLPCPTNAFGQGVEPGAWYGGNATTNTPYFVCLNVSADGQRITAIDTACRGAQGDRENALEINWEFGTTPAGFPCRQFSYRDVAQGDVTIASDGSFFHSFTNANVDTLVTGTFDTANGIAMGTARTVTASTDCQVEWTAAPAAAVDARKSLDPPVAGTPTAPPLTGITGLAPGKWEGGNALSNSPYYVCINVSGDGQRLTAIGTDCLGDQGQYQNSLQVDWSAGITPEGLPCSQKSFRGSGQGDAAIAADGSFTHEFQNNAVSTTVVGRFDAANDRVTGTATTITPGIECSIDWTAAPAVTP